MLLSVHKVAWLCFQHTLYNGADFSWVWITLSTSHHMQEKIRQDEKSVLRFLGMLEFKMLIVDPQ